MRTRGFTLIEVLVALAVVVAVSAILLPVLSRAKERALWTSDVSAMHQVALAASIYSSDNGGAYPLSVEPLVDGGLLAKILLSAATDSDEFGKANLVAKSVRAAGRPDPYYPYRNSFPTQLDYGLNLHGGRYLLRDGDTVEGAGWLILPTKMSSPATFWIPEYSSRYQRLLFSGTAVTRTNVSVGVTYQGRSATSWHPAFLYGDYDSKWMEGIVSGS